jgi:hypothetical protein
MNVYCFRIKDVHTKLDDQACEARIHAVFCFLAAAAVLALPSVVTLIHSLTLTHSRLLPNYCLCS